ncbi:hypothetical protein [Streptomyces lincolnensis]|uniref:hypothetical protein n=1 Tax=Streptomyces TaxID=1883 RepID=UPI001E5ECF2F|nr:MULTISPECIES: hypothetical protein [Streptomyces]MCD7440647.1 hypothetical protein [Streptomyces lincolnensis]WLW53374.1 hypothetical protein QU709_19195 [Streptomyces coralus]
MSKRLLRSVLVAAFSTVVAIGTLSGISGTKGDVEADSKWPAVVVSTVDGGSDAAVGTDDSAGS